MPSAPKISWHPQKQNGIEEDGVCIRRIYVENIANSQPDPPVLSCSERQSHLRSLSESQPMSERAGVGVEMWVEGSAQGGKGSHSVQVREGGSQPNSASAHRVGHQPCRRVLGHVTDEPFVGLCRTARSMRAGCASTELFITLLKCHPSSCSMLRTCCCATGIARGQIRLADSRLAPAKRRGLSTGRAPPGPYKHNP